MRVQGAAPPPGPLIRQLIDFCLSVRLVSSSPYRCEGCSQAAAPLLCTQIGPSSIVRGSAEESQPCFLLSPCDKFGQVWGAEGRCVSSTEQRCCILTCHDTLLHRCLSKWEGRGCGQKGLGALCCASVLSQVHISGSWLMDVGTKAVASLVNCSTCPTPPWQCCLLPRVSLTGLTTQSFHPRHSSYN